MQAYGLQEALFFDLYRQEQSTGTASCSVHVDHNNLLQHYSKLSSFVT
jgi:hypothetical protein